MIVILTDNQIFGRILRRVGVVTYHMQSANTYNDIAHNNIIY